MQNFRNLHVWQKAHHLALKTYEVPAYLLTPAAWPLRDQILRAAISIPSNIAEGAGRGSDAGFRRFLWHSMGSCAVHTRLGNDLSEVRKMLVGLIQTLK